MGGRIYDPELMRFLSPDPVVARPTSSQSWNSYGYAMNSPLSYVDPDGLTFAPVDPGCSVFLSACNPGGQGGGFSRVPQSLPSTLLYIQYGTFISWAPSVGYYGGEVAFGVQPVAISYLFAQAVQLDRDVGVEEQSLADEPMWEAYAAFAVAFNDALLEELADPETAKQFIPARDLYLCVTQGGCGLVALVLASGDVIPKAKVLKAAKILSKAARRAKGSRALRKALGEPPPGMRKPEAHHDLSQDFRDRFEEAGFDIDTKPYGRWVEGGPYGDHQKRAKEFNDEWEAFFLRNSKPTREEILDQMNDMRRRYH